MHGISCYCIFPDNLTSKSDCDQYFTAQHQVSSYFLFLQTPFSEFLKSSGDSVEILPHKTISRDINLQNFTLLYEICHLLGSATWKPRQGYFGQLLVLTTASALFLSHSNYPGSPAQGDRCFREIRKGVKSLGTYPSAQ